MDVAMMQPSFMPWLGYFELAMKADRFVVLDDFQFSVQSWHQRNRIFTSPGRVDWVTVPIQRSSYGMPLNATRIDETKPWRTKTWKRIAQSYSKAPHFSEVGPCIREWLETPAASLAELNVQFTRLVLDLLHASTELLSSSEIEASGERSVRVLELLRACEADRYLCARGAFDYMAEDGVFPVSDVQVVFQDFRSLPYQQVGASDEFIGHLSVIDALLNVGPDATARLIQRGTGRWLEWEEMAYASVSSGDGAGVSADRGK